MTICIRSSLSKGVRLSRVEDKDLDRRTLFREIREYAGRQLMISITAAVRVMLCDHQGMIVDTQRTKAAQPCQNSLFQVSNRIKTRFWDQLHTKDSISLVFPTVTTS